MPDLSLVHRSTAHPSLQASCMWLTADMARCLGKKRRLLVWLLLVQRTDGMPPCQGLTGPSPTPFVSPTPSYSLQVHLQTRWGRALMCCSTNHEAGLMESSSPILFE